MGRDVWVTQPSREGRGRRRRGEQFPEIERNKAQGAIDMLSFLQEQGTEAVNLVAHSEGAIYQSIALLNALRSGKTPKVRSFVLVEPAGSIGRDFPVALLGRFARQAVLNTLFDKPTREFNYTYKDEMQGMFSKELSQELIAISSTRIEDVLKEIHSYGIPIGVIAGQYDGVFSSRRLANHMATRPYIDAFSVLPIKHNGLHTNPRLVLQEVVRMQDMIGK